MSEKFSADLESLRAKYALSLPDKLRQIRELWSMLRYLSWTEQGLRTMHQMAHRLSGTSSTFGFQRVGEDAAALDVYLTDQERLGLPVGGEERERIDQLVATLCSSMELASSADETSQLAIPAPMSVQAPIAASAKSICIVDDDHALVSLITAYLLRSGFIVNGFDTVEACLDFLDTQKVDLVLMDLGFASGPLAGVEAIQRIQELAGRQLPVIFISARSDLTARLQALRAGGAGYITKPIDFTTLTDSLATMLDDHQRIDRVMIVDDDESAALIHATALKQAGFETLSVTQPMHCLHRAAQFKPDALLLDMHMPKINGLELAALLRQDINFSLLPIIFITSDTSEILRESAHAFGVNAVLTKPIKMEEVIRVTRDAIIEARRLKSRIERITQRSDNTSQNTRGYFFAAVENELLRSRQADKASAIYYLAIDHLDKLVSKYGHAGIAGLQDQFRQRMSTLIGSQEQWTILADLVACVLVNELTREQHQMHAEQIIRYLSGAPFQSGDDALTLNASVGIVSLDGNEDNANRLIGLAEKAHDLAYKQGGNCARFYEVNQATVAPAIVIKGKLPIENLSLSFQPIINLANNSIDHYDVLLRWRREDNELIPAAQFIHKIEDANLRIDLDRWVVQSAATALISDATIKESGTLFLHVSDDALKHKLFLPYVIDVLRTSKLRGARRLVIMASELWMETQKEQAEFVINSLRNAQCGVCLTHAGSTSSTAKLMTKLSFDYAQIANSLSDGLVNNLQKQESIRQLVSVAATTRTQLIATRVEDAKSLTLLWTLGVRLFQGYFIKAPGSAFDKQSDVSIGDTISE